MLHTALGFEGAITAPHRLAALAGERILADGGTAIEAMVAAASTVAVVYPHMNAIGGDGFWLIHRPGTEPVAISACGHAAALATPAFYADNGYCDALPARGPLAALTVPGTISGWSKALSLVPESKQRPLRDLLSDAIHYAKDGFAVTGSQARFTQAKRGELEEVAGFAGQFLPDGHVPSAGSRFHQPALGETLEHLSLAGLDDFYRGAIGETLAGCLTMVGSPLRAEDFASYSAQFVQPLEAQLRLGKIFNLPPPTQGVASLMILALFDRLGVERGESFAHVHGLVEATKQAFDLRNRFLGDPAAMDETAQAWLGGSRLEALATGIDMQKAMPWPFPSKRGDTIWMGAADRYGNVVSFIQSIFWEFGSGVVCPSTGVLMQNRGSGFSLKAGANQLAPGKRPFHTLNPALAKFDDGRVMAYGTMGGEGQPQTQAAIFTRYAMFGCGLQDAVTRPRWLLGRTWGDDTTSLKLEARFDANLMEALRGAGHSVELIEPFSDLAGHAGAVVLHDTGLMESASDPRADGASLAI